MGGIELSGLSASPDPPGLAIRGSGFGVRNARFRQSWKLEAGSRKLETDINTQIAAVAIGSNLGDRSAAIAFAVQRLTVLLANLTVSDTVQTEPEGEHTAGQPPYLNAMAVGETTLGAREILDALLAIERDFGRERPSPNAPRTLDLDLVMLGAEIVHEPGLQVPHPRFRDRFFVLGPLAEIAPDLRDPVTGLRVGELLLRLLRDPGR